MGESNPISKTRTLLSLFFLGSFNRSLLTSSVILIRNSSSGLRPFNLADSFVIYPQSLLYLVGVFGGISFVSLNECPWSAESPRRLVSSRRNASFRTEQPVRAVLACCVFQHQPSLPHAAHSLDVVLPVLDVVAPQNLHLADVSVRLPLEEVHLLFVCWSGGGWVD